MAWQDVPKGTALPVVSCIESGPEYSTGEIAGYTIYLAHEVDAAQLVLTMARLWDVPGVIAVSMDTPDALQLSIVIDTSVSSKRALRDVREAFESESAFTGAMLIRGCGCAHCKAETVVWLAVSVLDELTPDERRRVIDTLQSNDEVLTVAARNEVLILKAKISLLDSERGDAARIRALMASAGIHLENPHTAYVLRLARWASSRNSPHDW